MTVLAVRYGDDPGQVADLHLPAEPPGREDGSRRCRSVVVILHGGFWRARYDKTLGTPLAASVAAAGLAGYNLEYRRVGSGGGYPRTLADVAAGIDHLATLASEYRLDLGRVVAVGHSAGGQLAAWAASRHLLSPAAVGAGPVVRPRAVVVQAGVVDLVAAYAAGLGAGAVEAFLGGSPVECAGRYAVASPTALGDPGVPVLCVWGGEDDVVPVEQGRAYCAAVGSGAKLAVFPGDHMSVIDPSGRAWDAALAAVRRWTRRRPATR